MVQELPKVKFLVEDLIESETNLTSDFPDTAPAAYPVFYRTYSRRLKLPSGDRRESWAEVCDRTLSGLKKLGKLTEIESNLVDKMQRQLKTLTSGRWLWVGGTKWIEEAANFSGGYNCTSTNVIDWHAFGLMMDLAMQGSGTGAILEPKYISQLPKVRNHLEVKLTGEIGATPSDRRRELTEVKIQGNQVEILVGDSRKGWVKSYEALLELCSDAQFDPNLPVTVEVNVDSVRPSGETLKGFGGMANPVKLPELYQRCANILNQALGRQLNSVECCLLIDQAANCIVAGNIRRSAGIRQFSSDDKLAAEAKDNLWQQDSEGNWRIDPERDVLRMANHTRVFHRKPTLEECIEAVRKQYYSGEGAIQWAGEAIARSNADLLSTLEFKTEFLKAYEKDVTKAIAWLKHLNPDPMTEAEIDHRLGRYGLNPCLAADTWILTENGARQIKDLVGKQQSLYVNGELFSTTPEGFFCTGNKPVFKLETKEGFSLRLTENHQLLKVTAQTQKKQYSEWVETKDLQVGDRILLHNHRYIQPWEGEGNFEEAWLIGNLIGDGSLYHTQWNDSACLRFWQNDKEEMAEYAISLLEKNVGYVAQNPQGHYHKQLKHQVINSTGLARLAATYGISPQNKNLTHHIEQASYEFYRGFLQGLFDADGSVQGSQQKGVSIRLAQSNLSTLQAVQRMLARLGIISTLYQNRRTEGRRSLPDTNRQPAEYFCQAQHELVIANDNISLFQELIGFRQPQKFNRLKEVLASYQRNFNRERFSVTVSSITLSGTEPVYDCTVPSVSRFDANGIVAHNCGEILGKDFHCNLSEVHLNRLDPHNSKEQEEAFKAGAISVAALLNHQFQEPRYRISRELDPIVGVSFTGLFDFFVHAFGVEWLKWMEDGRLNTNQGITFKQKEAEYLIGWREIVHQTVWEYCDRHNLKRPNRCTTVQPSGTKSLLTGASPGWHPPKAQRFIRRITCGKNDPVALACFDYGYNLIPSQSDKDENGNLLNDPFDPRCTEWLVEIPVAVSWADLPGADQVDISRFSALTQMDFYMQVQQHYTRHNTSATIELRENEIESLGTRIFEAIAQDEGYISAALLARFDDLQTFPRLPFEPIDKETYDRLVEQVSARRKVQDFHRAIARYDAGESFESGPAGCDSDKCMLPESSPSTTWLK
jgi:ribonucleotide reductase, class II